MVEDVTLLAIAGVDGTRLKLSISTSANKILKIFLFTFFLLFVYFYINRSFPSVRRSFPTVFIQLCSQ